MYWDLLQAKFEKKNWFVMNCTNSDSSSGFPHKWEMSVWPITSHRSNVWLAETVVWVFLPLWCGGLPKWMGMNFSNVCWVHTTVESWLQGWKQEVSCWRKQVKLIYEDTMSEKAGFHENWWKSLWYHLM